MKLFALAAHVVDLLNAIDLVEIALQLLAQNLLEPLQQGQNQFRSKVRETHFSPWPGWVHTQMYTDQIFYASRRIQPTHSGGKMFITVRARRTQKKKSLTKISIFRGLWFWIRRALTTLPTCYTHVSYIKSVVNKRGLLVQVDLFKSHQGLWRSTRGKSSQHWPQIMSLSVEIKILQ